MIFVMISLLLVAGWIGLIRKYRRPENRNIIVAVFKNKRAIIAGVAWVPFVLVAGFISVGFRVTLRDVVPALIGGFAVAAVVNWFSRRRGAMNR